MSKRKSIPQRTRSREAQRREYQKFLEATPISKTSHSSSTGKEFAALRTSDSTAYIPAEGEYSTAPYKDVLPSKKSKVFEYIKHVAEIIALLVFFGGIVSYYNYLINKIDNVMSDLADFKRDSKEEIRHLTDRMDKYISRKR